MQICRASHPCPDDHLRGVLLLADQLMREHPDLAAKAGLLKLDGKKELHLTFTKMAKGVPWDSALEGPAPLDPMTATEVRKDIMMERFQEEHPHLDNASRSESEPEAKGDAGRKSKNTSEDRDVLAYMKLLFMSSDQRRKHLPSIGSDGTCTRCGHGLDNHYKHSNGIRYCYVSTMLFGNLLLRCAFTRIS